MLRNEELTIPRTGSVHVVDLQAALVHYLFVAQVPLWLLKHDGFDDQPRGFITFNTLVYVRLHGRVSKF